MMNPSNPIAILDSGLGGLTVVNALRRALPAEDLVYFGDTAHLPYGNKSPDVVGRFVRKIVGFLEPMRPKHIVIACNTATALALPALAMEFPQLSISGVIDPGARAAVAAAGTRRLPAIGVIATEATVRSKAYERAILQRRNLARVMLRPTPLLVPMIEEGRTGDDPLVETALRQYLQGMILRKIDVLVLGCTHYPLLKGAIAKVVGPDVQLIDSAEQCAQDVARRLGRKGLLRCEVNSSDDTAPMDGQEPAAGSLRTFVTDDPNRFVLLAARFLGMEIDPPTLVEPRDLPETADRTPLRATG
ncbi:MAG TPA: glutamate racemase [Tepidisphaeraceae bacterium]|jgi:glutamate racemase|nr:glutamate racemase [Tepidisphaeraceae bacterium]